MENIENNNVTLEPTEIRVNQNQIEPNVKSGALLLGGVGLLGTIIGWVGKTVSAKFVEPKIKERKAARKAKKTKKKGDDNDDVFEEPEDID